jgi:hypothetical protein
MWMAALVVGTMIYPGTHFVSPLTQHVELYTVRDQIYSTNPTDAAKKSTALKEPTGPIEPHEPNEPIEPPNGFTPAGISGFPDP